MKIWPSFFLVATILIWPGALAGAIEARSDSRLAPDQELSSFFDKERQS